MTAEISGTGQAPAPAAGQAPGTPSSQAGDAGTTEPSSQADGGERAALTQSEMAAELARARREAAGYRSRLTHLEKAAKDADDAKLSEAERLTKRVAELESAAAAQAITYQEQRIRYEVQLAAGKLGIADPDDAVKLLDWSTLEYDEAGTPSNVDKVLGELLRKKPYLAGTVAPGGGNPANPPRPGAGATQGRGDLAKLTPRQVAALPESVVQAAMGRP